ncbi:hypothetical protein [Actinotignum sp. GS-2025b]|uniref:hypothetical protein n=1 Tax=Actinotignum sp. GS-2025b TaxID=3427275 RepID=UPI003F47F820
MRITKRDTLRFLADPEDTIYRQLIRNAAVEAWNGTATRATLLQIYLDGDDWREIGNDVIKNGTDQMLVDLYFMLRETNDQLKRAIKYFDIIKATHARATMETEKQ